MKDNMKDVLSTLDTIDNGGTNFIVYKIKSFYKKAKKRISDSLRYMTHSVIMYVLFFALWATTPFKKYHNCVYIRICRRGFYGK